MVFKHKKDPLTFQGKKKSKKYFEGWYFKQVSFDLKDIVSVIPGISINSADSHAFIQIIYSYDVDGSQNLKTQYYRFSVEDFKSTDKPFSLKIGNNTFINEGIEFNLNNGEFLIKGNICFSDFTKIHRNILSPDAMGYFSYLPFMECYHDIISMSHKLKGFISVNNKVIDFNEGKGYIEKDWGRSFPNEYIWLQSNHFEGNEASIMFSLAHIPFIGRSFQGFICNFIINNREYRFATYNKSKIKSVSYSDDYLEIDIVKDKFGLNIKAVVCRDSGELKAPRNGAMDILIKEGLSGAAEIRLLKNSKVVFEGKANPCAIEMMYRKE
jgi:hypothetical protein